MQRGEYEMEKVKKYLEKAKDRVIHEFGYKDGKYIQHYVLGGEHELTPQEIIDCLNALATMDCDLQTAYAYIKGQDEKNKELKEQIVKLNEENKILEKALEQLKQQLAEKDKEIERLNDRLDKYISGRLKSMLNEKDKEIETYKEVLETYKKKPVNIYQVEIRNLQVDKAELKLEIEKLQDKLKRTEKALHEEVKEHLEYYNADQKQLRNEICNEIRERIENDFEYDCEYTYEKLIEVIDQVEKGEQI